MKKIFTVIAAVSLVAVHIGLTPALANSDDVKWIGACVTDNANQHQSVKTVTTYCTCMNDHMSNSETRSITEWEKSHKRIADLCSDKAGWQGR